LGGIARRAIPRRRSSGTVCRAGRSVGATRLLRSRQPFPCAHPIDTVDGNSCCRRESGRPAAATHQRVPPAGTTARTPRVLHRLPARRPAACLTISPHRVDSSWRRSDTCRTSRRERRFPAFHRGGCVQASPPQRPRLQQPSPSRADTSSHRPVEPTYECRHSAPFERRIPLARRMRPLHFFTTS
jgi:hypothetical protein